MIKINEIETDRYIIVSEDRIKELFVGIYGMIAEQKDISITEYDQLMNEINEILQVYGTIPNSENFMNEMRKLMKMFKLYVKDRGIINNE